MITYKVIDRQTGKDAAETYPGCPYTITPRGEVAWWDDSQGWEVDEEQERLAVVLLSYSDQGVGGEAAREA